MAAQLRPRWYRQHRPTASVAASLLKRIISDNAGSPFDGRLSIARDVIQTASRLGATGRRVAAGIVMAHPADHWVQGIALNIARSAPPTDDIVQVVADAVIGNEHPTHGGYRAPSSSSWLAA